MLELMFQLFVRPDDYSMLLKGMEAYNPKTVHYINRFHLFFEIFALMWVIPDFLPIFGVNPIMNTVKASVFAAVGDSMYNYIWGHCFFVASRLRLFSLVRHKRNHWINALYLDKKDAKRTNFDVVTTFQDATSNPRRLMKTKSKSSKFNSVRNARSLVSSPINFQSIKVSRNIILIRNTSFSKGSVKRNVRKMKTTYYQRLQRLELHFS